MLAELDLAQEAVRVVNGALEDHLVGRVHGAAEYEGIHQIAIGGERQAGRCVDQMDGRGEGVQ